ncbi:hypothetical protein LTR56_018652 [Elasticomyces elasticus]|nr:hypothetical protein LTR56_018652 [Elasticomyces elasticus]KAK3635663.1 hypothetical protein LTR22_019090 [Elasticomyces elasticus]KAK4933107.1 hypothetical protein LTR49_000591 [Elasticomyces elasticus]KAK5764006.1 hypothetical protein LTS12_005916 [Elasticomyces elasticus]
MNELEKFLKNAVYALKGGGLTPLQIDEIEKALVSHRAAQNDSPDLQRQREQIEAHWTSLSSTLAQRGLKFQILFLFGKSFASLLFNEYCELELRNCMHDYIKAMGTAEQRQEAANVLTGGDAGSRLDTLYEETVGVAITELMLDRVYVDTRFRNVALGHNITKNLHGTGQDVALLRIIEQDRAALRNILSFLPELEPARVCVEVAAENMLRPKAEPSVDRRETTTSSFWSAMGWTKARKRLPESPSTTKLLSDAMLAMKKME